MTHADAVAKLQGAGITISSPGGCSKRSDPSCTSFEQINSGTVDGIINFKRASRCRINITGGTEVGHPRGPYSHYRGYRVDITDNTCVHHYITRNFTYRGLRDDGAPLYETPAGNLYADEGVHWDILYY